MKKFAVPLMVCLVVLLAAALVIAMNAEEILIYKMRNAPPNNDQRNLAEELGYPADTKLLVVNSDDTGGHPAFVDGVFDVMESGLVKSTSVLVHDHNDEDLSRVAKIAKENPEWGFGIHLVLTNEYQENCPWRPVLPEEQVPSLYNDKGLMWEKISEIESNVDPRHAALEFEAQIEKALQFGIPLTHIDSHMGTAYRDSQFPGAPADGLRMAAIQMARKYSLPLTMHTFDKRSESSIQHMDNNHMIRPDMLFGFYELAELNSHLSYEGSGIRRLVTALAVKSIWGFELPYQNLPTVEDDVPVRMAVYKQAILSLVKPGLNHFYMHAASAESAEGLRIPQGKIHPPGADAIVRLADSEVWSSDEMRRFLEEHDVKLINYTELQKIQKARGN